VVEGSSKLASFGSHKNYIDWDLGESASSGRRDDDFRMVRRVRMSLKERIDML
jgi:hypothetical protein